MLLAAVAGGRRGNALAAGAKLGSPMCCQRTADHRIADLATLRPWNW